jgi:glycosyltransferase involved in cell wall biosynthesis
MSAGCAIITTNISGCPETIGKAGLLVEPENWRDLSQKIKKITKNEKELIRLQKLSRKRVENVFDWDVIIKEYINELGFRDH